MRQPRLILGAALSVAIASAFAASVGAATNTFTVRSFTEPAGSGLAVSGTLSDFVATSRARVAVPTSWRSRSTSAGRLRLAATQNPSCAYDLTYGVKSMLAPGAPAEAYVTAKLPAASSRHLLDSGTRGNRAFRVVRQPTSGGQVRVDALWAGVLTRRDDIAPAGQVAWTEVRVTARSRRGSECHAGTYREALGPAIGDSLAVARTNLRFTRRG